jgi:hypothetical protein
MHRCIWPSSPIADDEALACQQLTHRRRRPGRPLGFVAHRISAPGKGRKNAGQSAADCRGQRRRLVVDDEATP